MREQLSDKEKTLLQLIRKNPYISQQELAAALSISRPTVANLISGLMKKGYIAGRAYVLSKDEPIVCIGGANIDRKFHVKEKVQVGTSNPVKSTQSAGGVARNIAENLGRLGLNVSLLTCCGQDSDWRYIKEVSSPFMNLDFVSPIGKAATGSYTAILERSGEMVMALADMEVYEFITPKLLENHLSLLKQSKCIIADLNTPKEALEFLCHFSRENKKDIVLIPVSSPKMKRLPKKLDDVTWVITNCDETEAYFNTKINDANDWSNALNRWLSLGIKNVIITNGKKGALIGNREETLYIPAKEVTEIIDVTGAGDAFSAAVVYSWLEGKSIREIGKAGTINAYKTLQSPYTVRQDLTSIQLQKDMEEI
ncbi:carbohydrate kinase [Robertmurraya massiliosenegalensis]|uniref:carbohydrate kinase n=1 Tax=Robertmurraya massiliosenegalensis TaxID=1287657 RepID=UPI00031C18AA|nr:PfkB family carbohydrate kinase [Robertmurraya massiliosenegalensis]